MPKLLISKILLVLCSLSLSVRCFASPAPVSNDEKLTVGIIMPLSGEAASIGESCKNAMLMAYEQLTPDTKSKLQLIFEDDAMQAKNSVSAFNKLVRIDGAEVIVNFSSGTARALSPLTEQKQIPLIAVASDPQVVANKKFAVNFWVSPDEEAKLLIPEALARGYKNIARISTIQDGVVAANQAFDRHNQGRINIALDEEYAPDVKDFRTLIAKLRNKGNIDAIIVALMPGQLGVFAKQLRQAQVTLPIFGWEILEDSGEVKASDGALIGAWYVNAADAQAKFIHEFTQKYPNASLFATGNSYDLVLLLAEALKHGGTSKDVNSFLHSVKDFQGTLGTYSASGDNRFTLPAALKVVTKSGFETLDKETSYN